MTRFIRRPGWFPLLLAWLTLQACSDPASPTPDPFVPVDLTVQLVTQEVERPSSFAFPPGESRLYVTEQYCCVRIVENGTAHAEPFLDLSDRLGQSNEWGVLGIAFHPDFPANPYVYVSYTNNQSEHRVERYTVQEGGNSVDPASAVVLISTPQPTAFHVGGSLAFGPEGMLWISKGDGGVFSDEDMVGNAQNVENLHGTILRLDVDGAQPYSIPPDNPFLGSEGRDEIWHYGLRNPWRFFIDAPSGLLYIGDVGQGRREEVNVVPVEEGGHNFGWDHMEGTVCYPRGAECDPTGLTMPTLEYGHSEGCSVIGGEVYRGSEIPELQGHYVYADLCGGWVRSFLFEDGDVKHEQEWQLPQDVVFPTGIVAAPDGELYILTLGDDVTKGEIYKLVKADSGS